MSTFDLSPFYRSAIGFDRMANMLDAVNRIDGNQPAWPPYNIELVDENNYVISLAVAGFRESEIEIEVDKNVLLVEGRKEDKQDGNYLHRGIATRNFKRKFQLADHVVVRGARLEDGLLVIDVERQLPEALKPRKIAINDAGDKAEMLDSDAA